MFQSSRRLTPAAVFRQPVLFSRMPYFNHAGVNLTAQGLNARLELINKHPFYHSQSFEAGKGGNFETWKLGELEVPNQHTRSRCLPSRQPLLPGGRM